MAKKAVVAILIVVVVAAVLCYAVLGTSDNPDTPETPTDPGTDPDTPETPTDPGTDPDTPETPTEFSLENGTYYYDIVAEASDEEYGDILIIGAAYTTVAAGKIVGSVMLGEYVEDLLELNDLLTGDDYSQGEKWTDGKTVTDTYVFAEGDTNVVATVGGILLYISMYDDGEHDMWVLSGWTPSDGDLSGYIPEIPETQIPDGTYTYDVYASYDSNDVVTTLTFTMEDGLYTYYKIANTVYSQSELDELNAENAEGDTGIIVLLEGPMYTDGKQLVPTYLFFGMSDGEIALMGYLGINGVQYLDIMAEDGGFLVMRLQGWSEIET